MCRVLGRLQRYHFQTHPNHAEKYHILPTFKAPRQSILWIFGRMLYIGLFWGLSCRWLDVWWGSKQRFWGSNEACNFGTSHKIEVYGRMKQENAKTTSNHASLIYWLQYGINRLWPFGHFNTTINLSGKMLAEFPRFGQRLMGHHGRYGDRFENSLFLICTMDVHGSIEALVTDVV